MKKIFTIILLLLAVGLIILHSQSPANRAAATESKINIDKEINYLYEKYDSSFIKAIYSINEIRPYSIIQLDKISKLYNNNWLSPNLIYSKLDAEDEDTMVVRIKELLINYDNDETRRFMLNKIKYWCQADMNFNFMRDNMDIFDNMLMNAMGKIPSTKFLLMHYEEEQSEGVIKLTPQNREKAYTDVLNYISSLSFRDQLRYYSDIYAQLAGASTY